MNPQCVDEIMSWALALKQNHAQIIQTLQAQINAKDEEIKNLKLTSKPIKDVEK